MQSVCKSLLNCSPKFAWGIGTNRPLVTNKIFSSLLFPLWNRFMANILSRIGVKSTIWVTITGYLYTFSLITIYLCAENYTLFFILSSFLFAFLFPCFFLEIFYNLAALMNICHRFYIILASFHVYKWNVCKCLAKNYTEHDQIIILGDPEVTANLCCNFVYLYWEGCVICSIYMR